MNKQSISELPLFFNKNHDGGADQGYENLQDFFLSWTLRCAEHRYKIINPKLHEYAKQMIFFLIYGENNDEAYTLNKTIPDDFVVQTVNTRRQFYQIDLVLIVEVSENLKSNKYVLSIENKWYTSISNGQLEKYKESIRKAYDSDYTIIDLVIFADECITEKDPSQREKCKKNGYKLLTIGDLQDYTNMKGNGLTKNALFDEYWFNFDLSQK